MNRKWEVLRAVQNDFEVRELDGHARKNEIAIIKKIANTLFVVILLASVLIGILTVIPENVRAETWSITTVDSAGDVGWFTSIALDSNGYPHISYQDNTNMDLKYAKWTGSKWSITTVDSTNSVGEYTSIALDSKGYPHISYLYRTNLDLKYAKWTGSKWSITTVDSTNHFCGETSIALDSNDNPHISYRDSSNLDLKYAKWTGSKWSIETVDSAGDVGKYSSIALDSNNNPHISYRDAYNLDLKYAKWTGSKWSIETVDSTDRVGFETSIALNSKGYPHISYLDCTNSDLKYAKWTGSKWSIETVDSSFGYETSIALDSKGYPHISLIGKDLRYAKWTGNKWSIETVDSAGKVGYGTSAIALDRNDNPHISYWDASNKDLKYAAKLMLPKVPTQPRNLQATAGDGSVNLNWTAPSDDGGSPITNYRIYRDTTSGVGTLLTTVGKMLAYTDNDVTNDRTYYYQVSAENSIGKGAISDEASATPGSAITTSALTHIVTTPSAPRNFIATAGDRVVNLNWNAPVDNGGSAITEYTIYRGTSSDAESYRDSVSAPTTSYTDRSVTNDLIYYYKVSAENSVGEGEKSNEVDASPKSSLTQTTAPLVTTPSAPLNFKASAGDGNVNLEWTEPSDEGGSLITNYNIYRGTTSGEKTLLKTVSNVLSYTDDDVANNQRYYYQVSAVNSAGEGERSDEASATLIPVVTVPSAPQHLNADQGDEYVDLSWNPPSKDGGSPITEYKVYRGTAPQGESFLAEVGNAVIYTDSHVTNDQTYYYQVSAVNVAGEGPLSNEVSVTTPTPTSGVTTPSPTTTPVREGPDPVPFILIVVAIATLGGITLIIRHHIITPHHKKWQVEAKEEEPPEHCQYCTHHCRKIELELDPAMRKIAYLSIGAYDPVHGEQIKDGQVTGEIVDGLNKVVSARHRRVNAEKLQELVTPQAHALLQQIMGLLREELAPRDVSLTGHLEGGKVTCQFILYHCKRSGNVNIWEEEAKWEATIKDERDEPVGTLHSIAPSEPGISERLTPALTRLLMQFIEQV